MKILKYSGDFVLLAAIFLSGLWGIYIFRHFVGAQIAIAVSLGLAYVLWGTFHHHHRGNFHERIILEYVSIAALVVFILIVFLLRI